MAAGDADADGAGTVRRGDVERRVADDERLPGIEIHPEQHSGAFDRPPRELGAAGRVRAVAAEREPAREVSPRELDVRSRGGAAGRQAEQLPLVDESREQLLNAVEDAVTV